MTTVTRTLRSAAWLMALCVLLPWASVSGSAAAGEATQAPAGTPNLDMIRALQAASPHPSLGDAAAALDRLVGTWSVDYSFFLKDGTVRHKSGEYLAGWVMDGRAMQDFWIVYPSGTRTEREVYTTLRYVDPKSGTWYAAFIDPEHASVARFTGAVTGNDRVVVLTHDFGDKDDQDNRWSFNDIHPDAFVFRDEQSNDGGKTWRLVEEDHMTRRGMNPGSM